jgi:uncharacterized protein YprB with RNaseH-like and TPR domain
MNDLRARIAQIVETDRARRRAAPGLGEHAADSSRSLTPYAGPPTAARAVDGPAGVMSSLDESAAALQPGAGVARASFEVREQRIAVDDLGLEVVGRGAADPLLVAHLGLKGEPPERWSDILFLDTETTGLSGGTGTYVFLIGVAHIADGELILRQHLLRDIGAESQFVEHLKAELEPFRACASYNGKTFDIPLLRTRFVMALRSELTVDESHLDLLHPARRLWKDRFGSTTLRQLEESVLDDARIPDIAGFLIPDAYFHYLRTRDEKVIRPVLEHNARDVISLVRIADRVASAVRDARAGRAPHHAPAAFALARGFDRTGELDAAFACYESAFYDADNELRVRLALPYARALERRGDVVRVVRMLETLLDLGLGSERWREQAEARIRRLTRRKSWQAALATAS